MSHRRLDHDNCIEMKAKKISYMTSLSKKVEGSRRIFFIPTLTPHQRPPNTVPLVLFALASELNDSRSSQYQPIDKDDILHTQETIGQVLWPRAVFLPVEKASKQCLYAMLQASARIITTRVSQVILRNSFIFQTYYTIQPPSAYLLVCYYDGLH